MTLCGCATSPKSRPAAPSTAQVENEAPPADWWRGFREPEMDLLVERALAANADIRVALARVDQARALADGAKAGSRPQVNVGASVERQREGVNALGPLDGLFDTGDPADRLRPSTATRFSSRMEASWEFDLYGGRRAEVEAARANIGAREAELGATAVMVAGDTASAFIGFRAIGQRIELAQSAIATLEQLTDLVRRQIELGAAPKDEILRVQSALLDQQAFLAGLETERARLEAQIAVLTGVSPGTTGLASGAIPSFDGELAIALPAQALRARPDVQAAELALLAASAEVDATRADLYPKLVLVGGAGGESLSLQNVFAPDSIFWSIGPRIDFNLFSGGRTKARIRGSEARAAEAEAVFDKTVLTALQEVSDAFAAWSQANERADALRASSEAAAKAADAAGRRFALGAESLPAALQARRESLQAADAASTAYADASIALVAVFRATAGAPLLNTSQPQDKSDE